MPHSSGVYSKDEIWFNIHKSGNMTHHINKIKYKNHMIIPVDAEKHSIGFNIHVSLKTVNKMSKEGMYHNIINTI